MKLNKELVFEFMSNLKICGPDEQGITTEELAKELNMQRSNLSSILNSLVTERRIEKVKSRPVYYKLTKNEESFDTMIGKDKSLKNAINTAKAALLYPNKNKQILLLGKNGVGKSLFVKNIFNFAIANKVIDANSKLLKVNCRHYLDSIDELNKILFESESEDYIFNQLASGVIFIDHIDIFNSIQKVNFINKLENNLDRLNENIILICSYDDSVNDSSKEYYMQNFPTVIFIPSLNQRSFEERYLLIEKFLQEEVKVIQRKICINPSLMKCLVLYDCKDNIKQLKSDLKNGIMKAYSQFDEGSDILLSSTDLPARVRGGYLFYKKNKYQIENLIKNGFMYCIDNTQNKIYLEKFKGNISTNSLFEDFINFESEEKDEANIISYEIEEKIDGYLNEFDNHHNEFEQILKVCDKKIVQEVNDFLNYLKNNEGMIYPQSIFYGLCLHMNSLLLKKESKQRFSMQQVQEIMNDHKLEYQWSIKFCSRFEKSHNIKLPIDEVILVAMFLISQEREIQQEDQVVVLVAMHGNGTAKEIVNTSKALTKAENIYSFDLELSEDISLAYERFKETIKMINRNLGVLVLYDMGSFKMMTDMVSLETNIPIKTIEIPCTLMTMDCSRKASFGATLNEIYDNMSDYLGKANIEDQYSYISKNNEKVIITLCMSGEGGALRIKEYLIDKCSIDNIKIIPLAISKRNELLSKIVEINSKNEIVAIIGSYNPQIYGIKFIPLDQLFSVDSLDVKGLIFEEVELLDTKNYYQIFSYLENRLNNLDVDKLKKPLVDCINKLAKTFKLNKSVSIGLLMHIASMINRLVNMEDLPTYTDTNKILMEFPEDAKLVKSILSKLENLFDIDCADDEIAGIISIIKEL